MNKKMIISKLGKSSKYFTKVIGKSQFGLVNVLKAQFHTKYFPNRKFKTPTKVISSSKSEVSGFSKISNPPQTDTFKINGFAKVSGNILTNKLESNACMKTYGDIEAGDIKMNGLLKTSGNMVARNLEVNGKIKVAKEIDCEDLLVRGFLSASQVFSKNIEVEHTKYLKVDKIIAQTLKLHLFTSHGCLQRWVPPAMQRFFSKPGVGSLNNFKSIIANDIELSYCKADYVGGKNVIIGKGCTVKEVEYSGTLTIDEDATVLSKRKKYSSFDFASLFSDHPPSSILNESINMMEQQEDSPFKKISDNSMRQLIYSLIEAPNGEEEYGYLKEKLSTLSISLLRDLLLQAKLPTDGTKTELISRILSNL